MKSHHHSGSYATKQWMNYLTNQNAEICPPSIGGEVSDNDKACNIIIPPDEHITDNNETGDAVGFIPWPQSCSKASGITQ